MLFRSLRVTDAQPVRDRDFDSGELLSWPSGDAKMVLVLIGTAEDELPASYWVRGRRANDARRQAYTTAGAKGIAVGDVLTITRTGDIEIPPEKKGGKSVFANGWDMSVVPAGVESPAK